ncbi:MAG: hypothetical protein AAGD86_06770 [Pseudomonadota bacterium]
MVAGQRQRALATVCLYLIATITCAQTHPVGDAPQNAALIASPWPTYHAGPARQASIALPGPTAATPHVDLRRFEDDAGVAFGTSPWHILSARRYADAPQARAIWGVSLKYVYKYVIDGDHFAYVDHQKLNDLPFFIGWNFFGLADGRIVVPNPSGLRTRAQRRSVCAGREPALLVFNDGATRDSGIECRSKFEFTAERLEAACGFRRTVTGTTPVAVNVTYSGHIAVQLRRETGRFGSKRRDTWLGMLDNGLTRFVACAKIAEGAATNGVPMLPVEGGGTRLFVATDDEIVPVLWEPQKRRITREVAVPVAYRGRTGTTPTVFGEGERQWLVTVDARCAVTKVFSGAITCSEDTRASAVVAVPLPLGSAAPVRVALPDFIDTVENSPAAAGFDLVVTNYSGYTPDGKKDGKPDRATGLVKLSWNPAPSRFQIDWQNAQLQFSGVPTISTGANLVYGSGAEADGNTYFYGVRLRDDANGPAGALAVRVRLGAASNSSRRARDAIYDAGNNVLINDDGSAIMAGGESLLRLRDAGVIAAPTEIP